MADDAKADLAEAMPALNAAIESLKALNKNDIVEIKSFPKPPPLVQVRAAAARRPCPHRSGARVRAPPLDSGLTQKTLHGWRGQA